MKKRGAVTAPARLEDVLRYLKKLPPKERRYANKFVDWIWWRRGKQPERGGLAVVRQRRIDDKLNALFSTK